MSALGDYVTRLMMDTSGFKTDGAVRELGVLSGSIDSIMGKLARAERQLDSLGNTTRGNIIGSAGDPAKIQAALAMLDRVEAKQKAIRDLQESERQAAGRESLGDRLMTRANPGADPFRIPDQSYLGAIATAQQKKQFAQERRDLEEEMKTLGMSSSEKQAKRAELTAAQEQEAGEASRQRARERTTQMEKERKNVLADLRREMEALTRATNEQALAELRQKGASKAQIDAAQAKVNQPLVDRMRALGADPRDIAEAERLQTELSKKKYDWQKKNDSRGKWAGVEMFRAVEDFAQGSAYGGIKGGILAASNNMSQAFMAYGAYAGMIGAAASATVILGTVAYEAWQKIKGGGEYAAEAVRKYGSEIARVTGELKSLRQLEQQGRDAVDPAKMKNWDQARAHDDATKRDLENRRAELADLTRQMQLRKGQAGVQGMDAGQVERAVKMKATDDWDAWKKQFTATLNFAEGAMKIFSPAPWQEHRPNNALEKQQLEQIKNAHPDVWKPEFREQLVKEEQKKAQLEKELAQAEANELAFKKTRNKLALEAAAEEAKRRQQLMDDWALLGQGVLPDHRTNFERAMDQVRRNDARHEDESRKLQSNWTGGMDWRKSRATELAIDEANQNKTWGGASLQAVLDGRQNARKIDRLHELGVINVTERDAMRADEQKALERRIRAAKYGDLQADGRTGFNNQDIKTVGGFNAILQASRYSKEADMLAELKRSGDILHDIWEAQYEARKLESLAPVGVINF